MTTLAERLAKRKNLSPSLNIPFVHSGLYAEFASSLGKATNELTVEEKEKAVKQLSQLTLTITRLPQMTLTKVLRDASLSTQRDAMGLDESSLEPSFRQSSFGVRYYEALLNQVIKHITGWSDETQPFNEPSLKIFIDSLTLDEQLNLAIQYERAIAEEESAAAANPTK